MSIVLIFVDVCYHNVSNVVPSCLHQVYVSPRNLEGIIRIDIHTMKAGGYNDRNVVIATTKENSNSGKKV